MLRYQESSASARVAVAATEALEGAAVARAFRQEPLLLRRLRAQMATHVAWDDALIHTIAWLAFSANVLVYCEPASGRGRQGLC